MPEGILTGKEYEQTKALFQKQAKDRWEAIATDKEEQYYLSQKVTPNILPLELNFEMFFFSGMTWEDALSLFCRAPSRRGVVGAIRYPEVLCCYSLLLKNEDHVQEILDLEPGLMNLLIQHKIHGCYSLKGKGGVKGSFDVWDGNMHGQIFDTHIFYYRGKEITHRLEWEDRLYPTKEVENIYQTYTNQGKATDNGTE